VHGAAFGEFGGRHDCLLVGLEAAQPDLELLKGV
jgi:hypothetical protein